MASTPDEPTDRPADQPATPADEPTQPQSGSAVPPPAFAPPGSAVPPGPPPGYPPAGMPGSSAPPPPYVPPAGAHESIPPVPPAPRRPGVGYGVLAGFGLLVLATFAMFVTLGILPGAWGFLLPFIVIPLAAGALMFSARWRLFATGILIVFGAAWIVVVGPCAFLFGAFG